MASQPSTASEQPRLLIVHHSQSGACGRIARSVADGASDEPGIEIQALRCVDAGFRELSHANGLILIGAENFGAMAGGFKNFMDRIFYPTLDAGTILPYALIFGAGNDGTGAQRQLERILKGLPWRQVAEPLILRGEPSTAMLDEARDVGAAMAAGLVMGIF